TVRGRQLFSEKGCLACHAHQGTTTPFGKPGEDAFTPAVDSKANFGPNLSQVRGKLGATAGDTASARRWLVQWLKDPHVHSPRSIMPVTHLNDAEASDLAAWLLSQPEQDTGDGWHDLHVVGAARENLVHLASVYLVRILPSSKLKELTTKGTLPESFVKTLPPDEQDVARKFDETNLKLYVGKKAIGRMGCYGCHNIPGYENAK